MKKQKKAPQLPAPAPAEPRPSPAEDLSDHRAELQLEAPIVVGIGASAGGLEAMQAFLESMPIDTGLAFVHIQHLDPNRKTVLPEILRGTTRMRVVEAQDQERVAP